MFYRKLILPVLLVFLAGNSSAQVDNSFARADSLSLSLYQAGKWKELLQQGDTFIKQGTDFMNLRLRMAYAAYLSANFSEAKRHYRQALKNDSYNQTARYYMQLCESYLNHTAAASYHASFLANQGTHTAAIKSLSLESSFKNPAGLSRKPGYYNRIGLGIRLGSRIIADQSVCYFSQLTPAGSVTAQPVIYTTSRQFEYYGKLNYMLSGSWSAWAGYHFLDSRFNSLNSQSHIALLGIKYAGNYADVQADASLGKLTGAATRQYNATLCIYPLGNLNLYTVGRLSYHTAESGNYTAYHALAGAKLMARTWAEASVTAGGLTNFIEADGLYIYNAVDPLRSKAGLSVLYEAGKKSLLHVNYTRELKRSIPDEQQFIQHSFTAAISWKF